MCHAQTRKKKTDPFIAGPLPSFLTRDELGLRYWSNDLCTASHFINLRSRFHNFTRVTPCTTTPLCLHVIAEYPHNHTMLSHTGKRLSLRARSFLSSAFDCFTGPRSKAYHSISDLTSSARITPYRSRRFDPTPKRPTVPSQCYSDPINRSSPSQKGTKEAPQTALAQTEPPRSVDPEVDDIDGTYLCLETTHPDGTKYWRDFKLKPNQAYRADIDPRLDRPYLAHTDTSANTPSLETAKNLDLNLTYVSRQEVNTKYSICAPGARGDMELVFPFAFVTNDKVNVRGVMGLHPTPTLGGSEVGPATQKSTRCPSTSLPRSEPQPSYQRTAKAPSCAIELKGARGEMRKSGRKWKPCLK